MSIIMKIINKKNSGQVMLITVLVLGASILAATAVAGYLSLSRTRQVSDLANANKAQLAAETGIDWALYNYINSSTPLARPVFANKADFDIAISTSTGLSIKAVGQSLNSVKALEYPSVSGVVYAPPVEPPPIEEPQLPVEPPTEPEIPPAPQPEICDNGIDDDLDGFVDSNDSDCPPPPPTAKSFLALMPGNLFQAYIDPEVIRSSDGGVILIGRLNQTNGVVIVKFSEGGGLIFAKTTSGYPQFFNATLDGGVVYGAVNSVVKIDGSGNVQFAKSYQYVSSIKSVRQVSDGGYIVVGAANNPDVGYDGQSPPTIPQSDILVVKLDGTGNKQWSRIFGGFYSDVGLDIQEVSDGYIINGIFNGMIGSGGVPFVAKIDKYGVLVFNQISGSTGYNPTGIRVTSEGYFSIERTSQIGSASYTNLFKYDLDGAKRFITGLSNFDFYPSKTNLWDGFWSGINRRFSITGLPLGFDFIFGKYNPDGSANFTRQITGGLNGAYSIAQTNDGGFIVGGSIGSGNFVGKFNSPDNLDWGRTITGGSNSIIKYVKQLPDLSYIAIGNYDSARSFVAKFDASGRIDGCDLVQSTSPSIAPSSLNAGVRGAGVDTNSSLPAVADFNLGTVTDLSVSFNSLGGITIPCSNL